MKKETKLIKERAKQYIEASKNPANSKIRQEVYVLLAKEAERCAEICENSTQTVCGRLSKELKRTEKTIKDIARETDTPHSTAKKWVLGTQLPKNIEKLNEICDFYGLDKKYIYFGQRGGYVKQKRVSNTANERFSEALLATGMSCNYIADALLRSRKTVWEWVGNKRVPTIETIIEVCEKLGIDAYYVLTGIKEDENEG